MQEPIIILLAGGIGAGKDTVAAMLNKHFNFIGLAFADPLKESVANLFDFPCKWCYTREGKEKKPRLGGGKTVGQILQLYGTEVGRAINPDMWVAKAEKRIKANELGRVAITDCRFSNEFMYFCEHDFVYLFHLTRQAGALQGSRDAKHESENVKWAARLANYPSCYTIDNKNMTLEETESKVVRITSEIIEHHTGNAIQ